MDNSDGDDLDWLARSEYWKSQPAPNSRKPARRERAGPLILCGHGVSIKVDANTLLIRDGLTHYPQKQETYRFFKGDAMLPSRIVMLDGSGSITFDVLTWLSEQGLPLIKIDWTGKVVAVMAGDGFAMNWERVAWQAETRSNRRKRMDFCNALIAKKIQGCIETLETSLRRTEAWDRAMKRAHEDLTRLATMPPQTVDELRMLEAHSASAYFKAWRTTSLIWRASSRHPIPNAWRTIGQRSSRLQLTGNRGAAHPVNAILNYAYAILQSQVQIGLAADGYDPMIGIMHCDREFAPAFVFDMMEPERPKVDRAVLAFLKTKELHPADFVIRADGVVRINPELAKAVGAMSLIMDAAVD